jgi:hypothetical protein
LKKKAQLLCLNYFFEKINTKKWIPPEVSGSRERQFKAVTIYLKYFFCHKSCCIFFKTKFLQQKLLQKFCFENFATKKIKMDSRLRGKDNDKR